jgi:hypothetical protein
MRPALTVLLSTLLLSCTQEQSRPAKEAVAQAKAAAQDAQRTAEEAAREAKQSAVAAAAEADRAVGGAARAVQDGVATAEEKTRTGADAVASGVRELGQGGVVSGRVHILSGSRLQLRPEGKGPAELHVDARTRYLLQGSLDKAPLPVGTRVRATYVVEAHVPVATEVEVLSQ